VSARRRGNDRPPGHAVIPAQAGIQSIKKDCPPGELNLESADPPARLGFISLSRDERNRTKGNAQGCASTAKAMDGREQCNAPEDAAVSAISNG